MSTKLQSKFPVYQVAVILSALFTLVGSIADLGVLADDKVRTTSKTLTPTWSAGWQ